MNVLVIAPHPDDESIGCGGAVCKHTDAGDRVTAVFLTSGELGLKHLPREQAWSIREQEAQAAAAILGLAATTFLRGPDWTARDAVEKLAAGLKSVLERDRPEMIYLPHPGEWHPDHQAALPVLNAAWNGSNRPLPELRGYEIWTPLSQVDDVEDITSQMPRKLRAIRAHRSQIDQMDYARAIRGLNAYRGTLTKAGRYTEAFKLLELKSSQ